MKVLVLGGGIAGVTAAYYLAKDGHEVTLLEEQDGVGPGGQRRQAGMITPGPFLRMGLPEGAGMLLRSLLGQRPRSACGSGMDPAFVSVGSRFLRECTAGTRPAEHARQAPPLPVQPGP